MWLRLSRWLAILFGVMLPLLEGLRRWGTGSWWFSWADDFILGAALLAAAWASRRPSEVGRRCLVGAWGFTCGAGMMSVGGHLRDLGLPSDTNFARAPVAAILVVGWALALAALIAAVVANPRDPR